MKFFTIIISFLISFTGLAQTLELKNDRYVFEKVETVPTLSKQEVYEKARKWTIRNLKSSDSNIELDDGSYSQLTSTGNMPLSDFIFALVCYASNVNLNFKFNVFFKEGRYKVVFENMVFSITEKCDKSTQFNHYPLEKMPLTKKKQAKIHSEIEENMQKLCFDLHQSITGVNEEAEEDW